MVKIILFLLIPIAGVLAQSSEAKRTQASGTPYFPERLIGEIKVDGKLDESTWALVEPITDFMQGWPKIGAKPTEHTLLKITYDNDFLYVGIRAYDSFPSKIIATGLERDIYYGSDDNLSITIDTYNDKRQGVLFSTNPLGARFDEEVLNNGDGFNAAFNTFWNVRTTQDELGYMAEFQIPFSSLRFQAADEIVMGIKIVRYIKHKNEYAIFPPSDATLNNLVWRVNNTQPIAFKNLRSRNPFYLIPYGKINFEQRKNISTDGSTLNTETEFLKGSNFSKNKSIDKVLSNIGLDVKYGLSKNFTLDCTFNTDFAQAEADNRIFNFTRFGINLPEKRNFFLESKDYLGFSSGPSVLLFNSRVIGIENGNIVPIIGGARISGKANGLQLGFLDLQTKGIDELQVDPQHFTVLRMRKEVMGNGSFIGGIFTNRVSTKGSHFTNQALGVDIVKRFKDNKWMAAANLSSTNDQATPGFLNQSSMIDLVLIRAATVGYNQTTFLDYAEKNFKPLSGFSPDSAYAQINSNNKYVWKWKESKKANLYWIATQTNYKYRIINNTNELIQSELELGTSFKNGANIVITPSVGQEYIPYPWNFINNIVIPNNYYFNRAIRIQYDGKQTGPLNYTVIYKMGDFFSGSRVNFSLSGYYAINKNFRLTYNYEFNNFNFPERYSTTPITSRKTNLIVSGLTYTQSIYFSMKMLIQYDDISKTIGGNFRIRINPKEGTDLFIVYNPRLNTVFAPNTEHWSSSKIDRQTLIIKFSKALSL